MDSVQKNQVGFHALVYIVGTSSSTMDDPENLFVPWVLKEQWIYVDLPIASSSRLQRREPGDLRYPRDCLGWSHSWSQLLFNSGKKKS